MLFARRRHEPPAMTLEGVMGPNIRLDEADGIKADAPGALCTSRDGTLFVSSGRDVLALTSWPRKPAKWATFASPVTALCASPGGLVAVGLEDGRIAVLDAAGKPALGWTSPVCKRPVTDCAFASEDEIVAVDNGYGPDEDFMSAAPWDDDARGQVVAFFRSGASKVLAEGLHCPMGIVRDPDGQWIVTLFERGAIVGLDGKPRQSGFPAYLGRIRKTSEGYAVSCLARRDPLIEFLKTERDFIADMKANVEPHRWISPRATPEFSHDFPIEVGATRLYGEVKPWAPSFSYGLIIELDDNLMPVRSAHSRANGTRHAISDVLAWNGSLMAVSKSSAEILRVGEGGAAA